MIPARDDAVLQPRAARQRAAGRAPERARGHLRVPRRLRPAQRRGAGARLLRGRRPDHRGPGHGLGRRAAVRLPQRAHRRGPRGHRPGRGDGPPEPPDVRGGRARARRRRRGPAGRGRDRALTQPPAKARAGAPRRPVVAPQARPRCAWPSVASGSDSRASRSPTQDALPMPSKCRPDPSRSSGSSRSAGQKAERTAARLEAPRGHSSDGRAPALQAGGRRFDPGWLHQKAPAREQISRVRPRCWTRRVPALCSLCAARERGEGHARRLAIRRSQPPRPSSPRPAGSSEAGDITRAGRLHRRGGFRTVLAYARPPRPPAIPTISGHEERQLGLALGAQDVEVDIDAAPAASRRGDSRQSHARRRTGNKIVRGTTSLSSASSMLAGSPRTNDLWGVGGLCQPAERYVVVGRCRALAAGTRAAGPRFVERC